MVLFVQIQYREIHKRTLHSKPWHKGTKHLLIQLVYKYLYCLVDVILLFQTQTFPILPYICSFAPPNPSELTVISTAVDPSRLPSVQHSRPVLCHCVCVFISSCYDFSWSLVVWCWYRWWCCACVEELSSHGFDFLPSSGRTQSIICSLSTSTHGPPPLWNLQLPIQPNPVMIIIFHTFIKDAVHIHHPFGCCFPPPPLPF